MIARLPAFGLLLLIMTGTEAVSSAWGQGLQPESRQEFQRVFGLSGNAARQPAPTVGGAPTASLQPETINEFRRLFGQNVLSGAVELQRLATPETINSTALNALLASTDKRKYLMLWHLITVDITAIDHRAVINSSPSTYHEQFGPARAARALGLVHQAMFEAANVFDRKYASTLSTRQTAPTAGASQDAAIIEAAYQLIAWLYPGLNDQTFEVDDPNKTCTLSMFSLATYYACSLETVTNVNERLAGIAVGRAIAGQIIAERSHDGAERLEPIWGKDFVPRQLTGDGLYPFVQWQVDPVSGLGTALGAYWGEVKSFAMTAGFQFRPQESGSPASTVRKLNGNYKNLASYNAVRQWGKETRLDPSGKPTLPPSVGDAFFLAQFWAYDGTANLCAPVRLYNQIAAAALKQIEDTPTDGYPNVIDPKSVTDIARFYALINMAMADAAIAAWDSKYHFQFPRPVTYIRASDELDAAKMGKPVGTKWFPVGAQVTNSDQTYNITPPFPAYPSGHAVFGGSVFGTLRQFIKPTTKFKFLSDEFNGKNKDVYNYIRCLPNVDKVTDPKFCAQREFTLDCAERENADSRIFMGVHWIFDADDGIFMGNQVARQVYRYLMKPIDAQGQPSDPPSQSFSVLPTTKKRADLVCTGIHLPMGWDDPDATKGFGPLVIQPVN
jgi:hypothetical protein